MDVSTSHDLQEKQNPQTQWVQGFQVVEHTGLEPIFPCNIPDRLSKEYRYESLDFKGFERILVGF